MQKHKASNNVRTAPFLRIVTVTIVVLGIGYFLILDPYLDNRDKQKFLDAQAFIEQTFEEKVLPVAEPSEVTRIEHCGYSGQKYSRGNLSCTISITAGYARINYEGSLNLTEKLAMEFDQPVQLSNTNDSINVSNLKNNTDRTGYTLYQSINEAAAPCSISYQFSSRSNITNNLSVTLNCSESARAEHF